MGAWIPYASVYFQARGIDLALIGILGALPFAVAIVGAPTWGLIADRLGDVRPPMLVAALWAAAAAAWLLTGPPMPWLAIGVIALAAGTSALTPLLDARTIQRLGAHRERYGQARMWGSVGFIAVSVLVGVIVQATEPAGMLAVYAALLASTGIAAAALLGRGRRPPRASGIGPLAALRLLRQPAFGLFFVGSVVVWIAATGVMAFFSLRLVELGGDARLVGLAWGVNALAEVPVMFGFRRLARRVSVERLLVAGALVFAGRSALWTLTGNAAGLVLVAGLGGPGFALYLVGTIAYVAARAPAHLQATAQALFSGVAFAIGNIIGAVLAGMLAEAAGLTAVFPAAALASLGGAGLIAVAVLGQRGATATPSVGAGPG